jgi:hypothetical protein
LEYRARALGEDLYPLVTKEQRQKHREIWGEMIENKKRESKRELRNLQSFVNYGDVKALRGVGETRPIGCRVGCFEGFFVGCSQVFLVFWVLFGFFCG